MEVLTPGELEGYFDEYEEIAAKFASREMDEYEHKGPGTNSASATG
jgi:hypothetical protein